MNFAWNNRNKEVKVVAIYELGNVEGICRKAEPAGANLNDRAASVK